MEVLDFDKLKTGLRATLLSRIDLEKLSSVDDGKARRAVANMIQEIIGGQKVPLNSAASVCGMLTIRGGRVNSRLRFGD